MSADRGHRGRAHVLQTPANRYPSRLPWLPGHEVVKLVSPRLAGAQFAETLLLLDALAAHAELPSGVEQFLYVLAGELELAVGGEEHGLGAGGFAYLPPNASGRLTGARAAQVIRVHRPWTPAPGVSPPGVVVGHAAERPFAPTAVPGLDRSELLDGADPAHDFTMSLMRFVPGGELGMVEIHDEEHGLLMVEGSGSYLLDDGWHDVLADDFIYLGPYCPQGFVAGPEGATYLIYKDANREVP